MNEGNMMQRWEYLTIPESERGRLKELGDQGWELIAVDSGSDEPTLYLKRPAPSFRERVTLAQRERYLSQVLAASPDREKQL